ncbi:serine hydrolase domain-containing protein [Amycolatopsis carbonis]|uniref:Serine hydrolase domain-containing protein n=1 Tax=Amycolatopsis carbonis TaxID=715471 RepID=A0A9Y2MST4_9PSEU|nr:serine hydrolase domain-containing protein [Amycolatopsis sp. 2-15]WIX76193.1 serine hydrolase domain-containing protein [Amycolatopsis sp. 2-15]
MVISRRAILAQATLAAAGGPVWTAAPATATGRPRVEDSLRAAIRRLHESPHGPPAVVVAIGRGPGTSLYTAGVPQLGARRDPRAGDRMRVASVAKAFSGATALSLVSSGRLSLDTTVGRTARGMPREWSAVTLRQLLGHTSGIPDFSGTTEFRDTLVADLHDPPPPQELLSYATDPDLLFRPGSRYEYSNSDNILVALMCEAATGRRYEDVLRQRVLQPLGLRDTSLPRGPDLPEPALHGYDTTVAGPPEDVTSAVAAGWSWASGGMVSAPADLVRFIRGYVGGDLIDHKTRDARFRSARVAPNPPARARTQPAWPSSATTPATAASTATPATPSATPSFTAATPDGRGGVAVSITAQITRRPGRRCSGSCGRSSSWPSECCWRIGNGRTRAGRVFAAGRPVGGTAAR